MCGQGGVGGVWVECKGAERCVAKKKKKKKKKKKSIFMY